MFIDVNVLERRQLRFDETFEPGVLSLPDNWQQAGALRAAGSADLLDRHGSRTVVVRGRITGVLANACSIGLEPISRRFDEEFELYYYPESMAASQEHVALSRDDADVGFYEGGGLPLRQVIEEQVALWLPMRPECEYANSETCPYCERNLGRAKPAAAPQQGVDSRWAALEKLKLQ